MIKALKSWKEINLIASAGKPGVKFCDREKNFVANEITTQLNREL